MDEYEYQDHLGNVRATFGRDPNGDLEVFSYADYYPFGWKIPTRQANPNEYRFGYQGEFAEQDQETGWNSFELRMYDGRVGRWMTIDPMEEFYSPYLAMGNDPINLTDPTGGITDDDYLLKNDGTLVLLRRTNDEHRFYNEEGYLIVGPAREGDLVYNPSPPFWEGLSEIDRLAAAFTMPVNELTFDQIVARADKLDFLAEQGFTNSGDRYRILYGLAAADRGAKGITAIFKALKPDPLSYANPKPSSIGWLSGVKDGYEAITGSSLKHDFIEFRKEFLKTQKKTVNEYKGTFRQIYRLITKRCFHCNE